MFDIGWSELMVIGVVALIAIGPKELPGVLRMVGQWMGKARKLAAEFQGQFQEAMREAEMADLKKSFDEVKSAASGFADNNVLTSLQKDVDAAMTIDKIENIDTPPAVPTTPEPPTAETLARDARAPRPMRCRARWPSRWRSCRRCREPRRAGGRRRRSPTRPPT